MIRRALHRWVLRRRWATFMVLGLSFVVFGAGTLNLAVVMKANFDLIVEHGWMALMDGAAQQLVEMVVTVYLSMLAYVVFKLCEYALVHDLIHPAKEESNP